MSHEEDRKALAVVFSKLSKWTEEKGNRAPEFDEHDADLARKASEIICRLAEGDTDPWWDAPIHKIVRKAARYIVFLDDKLNVKWWWVRRPDMAVVTAVEARTNELTHESAFLLDEAEQSARERAASHRTAEDIRSLVGEAMALAISGGSRADCEVVLQTAEREIAVAKDQRCRWRFIAAFVVVVCVFGSIAIANYLGWIGDDLKRESFVQHWLEAAVAGSFGALISALTRTKALQLEPAAKTRGLAAEAVARALIGAAAGILVSFAFDGGLLMKDALKTGAADSVRLFLCLAAGISERILPALVGKAEDVVSGQKKAAPAGASHPGGRKATAT